MVYDILKIKFFKKKETQKTLPSISNYALPLFSSVMRGLISLCLPHVYALNKEPSGLTFLSCETHESDHYHYIMPGSFHGES